MARLSRVVLAVVITAAAVSVSRPAYGDFATDCQNPTQTLPGAGGMPGNLNLTAADRVLFQSGTFTCK